MRLRINGKPALGILCLAKNGAALVSSLCLVQGGLECPLFSHVLTPEEIASLRPASGHGRRHLTSTIALTREVDEMPHDSHHQEACAFSPPETSLQAAA